MHAPLSLPRMSRYRPLSPKKFKKYHESEDTQRTSMSGVSMPRCSMDLNPSVSGNGSLTVAPQRTRQYRVHIQPKAHAGRHTEHEALEEKVDPAHYDHLRDHHHHLRLHARHHAVHLRGVGERVGRRLRTARLVGLRGPVFEVGTVGEGLVEVLGDGAVERGGKGGRMRGCAENVRAGEGASAGIFRGIRAMNWRKAHCSRSAGRGRAFGGDCKSWTT
jgi:hypothetical protein